jgi:hypothetical protein
LNQPFATYEAAVLPLDDAVMVPVLGIEPRSLPVIGRAFYPLIGRGFYLIKLDGVGAG